MDREIWRGKDVGYIVKKKMNRSCRKNGMVSVNRWGFGSVNRAVKKGEGKEMDQEIKQRIETLKKEKDAVILAHYYVDGEVQEIADYVGDSYYLAELATTVPQKTIIFCGVSFMGESAKILSPEKTVIMADRSADCPMAHMVEVEKIRGVKSDHAVNKLVEYGLVEEVGRLDAPGRPILFGTTEEFLRRFSVPSIDDLPSLNPEQMEHFKEEAEDEAKIRMDI